MGGICWKRLFVLLALALLVSLCACAATAPAEPSPPVPVEAGKLYPMGELADALYEHLDELFDYPSANTGTTE